MNYKVKGALNRNKKTIIIGIILWLVLVIVFVAPFSYSIFQATINNKIVLSEFMKVIGENISNPFGTLGNIFSKGATENFLSTLMVFSIAYVILLIIGTVKSAPKHEYSNIEHGSSDWSEGGEQYKILNKNKGIILAENNYLPVDKRGNVNVLVVGRIRFW